MILKDHISTGLATAKDQAVTWVIESIANNKNGNDTSKIDAKIVALTTWIDILQDYYDKKYESAVGRWYIHQEEALLLLARMNALDFGPQNVPTIANPDSDFDASFDNSFS